MEPLHIAALVMIAVSINIASNRISQALQCKHIEKSIIEDVYKEIEDFLDIFGNKMTIHEFNKEKFESVVQKNFFDENDPEERCGYHHDYYGSMSRIDTLIYYIEVPATIKIIINSINDIHKKMNEFSNKTK